MTASVGTNDNSRATRQAETNRLLREARTAPPAERRRLVDEVITRNLPVARAVALRYRDRGVALDDLVQVACTGLVRAADRFDSDQAEDFLTYAIPTIRGELKRYFRDQSWTIRPPRRVQEVQALVQRSGGELGLTDRSRQLADRLGLTEHEVDAALTAQGCFTPTSLDEPSRNGGAALSDVLASEEADFESVEARIMVRALVRELEPRDRLIMYLRFFENRTQREIGDEIGVTQMQVSRLIARIMTTMRTRIEADPSGDAMSA
jgi:RNA polymerase sigma-B factor